MQNKTWKIKQNKLESTIKIKESFGWVVESQFQDLPSNNFHLTMKRDTSIPNFRKVCSLEKKYKRFNRPLPIATLIWAIIGTAGLVCYSIFIDTMFAVGIYVAMIICYGIAAFLFLMYIIILLNRKKLTNLILKESRKYVGLEIQLPTPENSYIDGVNTWNIFKNRDSIKPYNKSNLNAEQIAPVEVESRTELVNEEKPTEESPKPEVVPVDVLLEQNYNTNNETIINEESQTNEESSNSDNISDEENANGTQN